MPAMSDSFAPPTADQPPVPGSPLLEAEQLGVRVGGRWLCQGLNLRLETGTCTALLGPNGAGKTTLLHTLAGLRPPDAGHVRLDGKPYPGQEESAAARGWDERAAARLRGLLPQQQPDHFAATVLETVLVGRHPHLGRWGWEGAADETLARAALRDVGLAGMEARNVLTLSGGERQRVAIATLLAQAPRLFLLDEPLNHLDLRHQIATLDLFRRLAGSGHGIVMVMHDLNLAARYADRAILLDGQGGATAGFCDEVLRADALGRAFGHPLSRHEVEGRVVFMAE